MIRRASTRQHDVCAGNKGAHGCVTLSGGNGVCNSCAYCAPAGKNSGTTNTEFSSRQQPFSRKGHAAANVPLLCGCREVDGHVLADGCVARAGDVAAGCGGLSIHLALWSSTGAYSVGSGEEYVE